MGRNADATLEIGDLKARRFWRRLSSKRTRLKPEDSRRTRNRRLRQKLPPAPAFRSLITHEDFLSFTARCSTAENYPFSSFFSSLINLQSVPCAMSFLGPVLIIPISCRLKA